jgi:phosphate/sulfate permease
MSYALAFFLIFTVLSRSGNDVAKAIGPLMAIPEILADPFMALLAGGVGMCLGVIVLGRRVVKKLAKDIVALSPSSALAASIAVSIIMFVGTVMAIPLSGSHILVAAFIGVGFVNKEKVDMDMLKEIGWSWIITTPISAIFSGGLFLIAKMFM